MRFTVLAADTTNYRMVLSRTGTVMHSPMYSHFAVIVLEWRCSLCKLETCSLAKIVVLIVESVPVK